jgi:F0F1-type ATP synthase membrane subunit c/vacuolar-type H+-ATPase subunit K
MELGIALVVGVCVFVAGFTIGMAVGTDDTVDAEFENLDSSPPTKKGK